MKDFFNFSSFIAFLDIAIVTTLLYWLMILIKGTRAAKMAWGIGIIVVLYFASERAELLTLHWILEYFLGSIIILIIVVFQQDIRRGLMHMGRTFSKKGAVIESQSIAEITAALTAMSKVRMGALIAIERGVELAEIVESGVELDAKISKELLLSIFNPDAPLHDGAVIIKGEKAIMAGAILPLTDKELSTAFGTRHRAAVGISEESDSVVLVVSEKSGEISFVTGGVLEQNVSMDEILRRLRELHPEQSDKKRGFFRAVR